MSTRIRFSNTISCVFINIYSSKNGILIKDRRAFETIRDVNVVVFDKTGTLTVGKFGVSDVISFIPEKDLLRLTASVEVNSEHVIAKAIVEYAKNRCVKFSQAKEFKALPGKGAYGKVGKKDVYVGSINFLEDLGIKVDDPRIIELQGQGKTIIFTIVDGVLASALALADSIRAESYEAVKLLRERGIKVYILTGDSEEVARWVVEEIGADDYFARVLPDQKAEKIRLLREGGNRVAMVGDGVNDAPALVAADVGIAIGAGTDVAIESADIILVKSNPRDVVKVIDISRKVYSKMMQNLWWAAGYNIVTIPLAAGLLSGLGLSLPPAIGAIIMSLSTIIVAFNSQTLRKYEPEVPRMSIKKSLVIDPVCKMRMTPIQPTAKLSVREKQFISAQKSAKKNLRRIQ